MKLKQLESAIQEICPERDFGNTPTIELEQYSTPPRLAATLLLEIQDFITERIAFDLGCGCGVLSAGISVLEASMVYCLDIDQKCLDITSGNLNSVDIKAEFIRGNVEDFKGKDWADVVVTNPPFGTRKTGIDWVFVEKGLVLAPDVFSFHKTSTRKFFQKKVKEGGIGGEIMMTVPFELPKMYKIHKKKAVNVDVDIWHFSR
ncbi:hypothetical protein SteCoe_33497 [Stentor coeruleus]|uniref:Methyltransferase-like protein 5 n=1 Tax=Stentor coeruleus TaxID=5963 RepID=A0A1R2AWT9_9CILI|nr:hypothetical protein SteCoe_33497 [Stentor coeruleus]